MVAVPAVRLAPLFEVPGLRAAVAQLIHDEFWLDVPGASAAAMAERLRLADGADRVPLCRVAVHDGQAVGVANLVDSDDDNHPKWSPWLAGLVVRQDWRGRGVGTALVRTLLADARALGLPRLYFGTDGPGFYTRLGAVHLQQPRPGFWFMRFDLPGPAAAGPVAADPVPGCAG